ncbi:hypothetical protein L9F63_020553 [Diploptera punctata]|uniref:Uncharacterized protein n=1 Tax=Diploptera punctata TaxID=6984 RepID=A0AAD7ZR83_DIPPU|nr:hypothetical protein L9F63_020553 [Diploptera punctata]
MNSLSQISRLFGIFQRNSRLNKLELPQASYHSRNITSRQNIFQIYQRMTLTTCGPPGKSKMQQEEHQKASYYRHIAKKQAKFQVHDDVPIYLKGGAVDKFLYQTTLLLCWIGLFMGFKTIYDLSYPKAKGSENSLFQNE